MTPHMLDFIRNAAWHWRLPAPVLEIGSYIEKSQDHLDLRQAFPPGTPYIGTDVISGLGVDRLASLLDDGAIGIAREAGAKTVLCLYVLEHVWDIQRAAHQLADIWRRDPGSWLFVSTHQNQPYHGTINYPDFWRITTPGFKRLFEEAGLSVAVVVHPDSSNPTDVLAVRPPADTALDDVPWSPVLQSCREHWERHF